MSNTPNSAERGLELVPNGELHEIRARTEGAALARFLLSPERAVPVVVVSIHPLAPGPYLDAAHIADELKGAAATVLIGADATYGLTDGLGSKRLSVFFGAGRIYPVGSAWVTDVYKAPLYLCLSRSRAARVAPDLMEAALTAAHTAGVLAPGSTDKEAVPAVVTVVDLMGRHHVRVSTPNGKNAALLAAQLRVGVPAGRLVTKGQKISGRLKLTRTILDEFIPDAIEDEPLARARAAFADGTWTLARVASVDSGTARGQLHPDVPVSILSDREDMRLMLSPGDTVGIEVVWEASDAIGALLADPTSADLAPALSVLPGGPPWLLPEDMSQDEASDGATDLPQVNADYIAPDGLDALDLDTAVEQLRDALDMNELLEREVDDSTARVQHLQAELGKVRSEVRRSHGKVGQRRIPPFWRDPRRQLRHDIYNAYLARIPEDDRAELPLPDEYTIGEAFVGSLDKLQGVNRDKVLDVIVECLVGLDKSLASRERRPWLASKAGGQQERPDGAKAWRINVQSNTPGARRLKYWVLTSGTIELDSVGHHDDGIR